MPFISHERLVEEKKQKYYVAFRKTQITFMSKEPDIVPWLTFFLIIIEQSKEAVNLVNSDMVKKTLSKKQLAILEYLEKAKVAASGDIATNTKLVHPTVG